MIYKRCYIISFVLSLVIMVSNPFLTDLVAQDVFETADSSKLEAMLANYIAQDKKTQTLALQYQQALFSQYSAENSAGFNVELSTGTIAIQSSTFKMEPSVTLSMPTLNGATVKASVPLTQSDETNGFTLAGASVNAEAEIIGSSAKKQEVALLKVQRSVLEAKRSLKNQLFSAEKDFYNDLKSLYNDYSSLVAEQNTLYEKKIDLEALVVQGYSTSSSKYRTAQMDVLTSERSTDAKERTLQRNLNQFAKKCGLEGGISMQSLPDVSYLLQKTGVLENPIIGSLENYSKMESAQWNLAMEQVEQAADSSVTISAGLGYTHKNSQQKGSDTISATISASGFGGKFSGGFTMPVTGEDKIPTAQFSLSWSPGSLKAQNLAKEQSSLALQLASLNVQEAQESYDTDVEQSLQQRDDLLWNREMNLESYALYDSLANDMEQWYSSGLITETEYRKALINKQNALIQCRISDINLLLYSIETKMLFIAEEN